MRGIFVNENGCIHYASMIVAGWKKIETRSRDMLGALVGDRVAIVRTRRGKSPVIVGYARIAKKHFCPAEEFRAFESLHFVPEGSAYDCHGKGKWFYWMEDAEVCDPYILPKNAVRHGFSWCEFEEV